LSAPVQKEDDHWTYRLYAKNPDLYLPILDARKEIGVRETEGLNRILKDAGGERAKVLDLACGIGRHSIPLAKMGYEVVGVDLSQFFLDRASAWAAEEGLSQDRLRFHQGDMRKVAEVLTGSKEVGFGVILNLFSSLGSYGEEEDLRLFKNLHKISAPNCLFVIETLNRDFFVRKFQPVSIQRISQKLRLLELTRLNLETSTIEDNWRFYTETAEGNLNLELDVPVTGRVYTLLELKRLVTEGDWTYLKSQGNIMQAGPVTPESPSIVLVSRNR
jgi:SAM-dependent methyltransferase